MSKKDEALKLALEALAVRFSEGWHEGIKIDASDIMLLNDAAQALAEQPAQQALDKKAENAREIGLDYEPAQQKRWAVFCQGCRKEWSVSYPHPGKSICADCDDKLAEEQPAQQEPVAWLKVIETPGGWGKFVEAKPHEKGAKPVYTSPPAQQGQVAWTLLLTGEHHGLVGKSGEKFVGHSEHYKRVDVYTSPQRTWVGLTDEEWQSIADTLGCFITRGQKDAIEAALGIKENT